MVMRRRCRRGFALLDAILGGAMLALGLAGVVSLSQRALAMLQRGEREAMAAAMLDELLGQVITYVLFFVLCWGWIFWRLDRIAGPEDQQIIEMPSAASQRGSFNYYYGSMMSILEGKKMSLFIGISRFGKALVGVHSLMILDLAAIALARFYQLVQKSVAI